MDETKHIDCKIVVGFWINGRMHGIILRYIGTFTKQILSLRLFSEMAEMNDKIADTIVNK